MQLSYTKALEKVGIQPKVSGAFFLTAEYCENWRKPPKQQILIKANQQTTPSMLLRNNLFVRFDSYKLEEVLPKKQLLGIRAPI